MDAKKEPATKKCQTGETEKPSSSHPDADTGPSAQVTDAEIADYQREKTNRGGIVSINGEDVEPKTPARRAA